VLGEKVLPLVKCVARWNSLFDFYDPIDEFPLHASMAVPEKLPPYSFLHRKSPYSSLSFTFFDKPGSAIMNFPTSLVDLPL